MAEVYSFGRFTLDAVERRLYANDLPLPLGHADIRLLTALVKKAGSLVPKSELLSRVWGGATVTENTLYVHINGLRKILGDDCITNKQGQGYRFVAQVQCTRSQGARPSNRAHSGNLPTGLSRLIGRNDHLRVTSKLLARNRLVTLTGPGGVGKTKLALHAAGKNASHFPDGVWLVELASSKEADLVFAVAATVLGVDVGDGGKPLDTLVRHLARRRLLVVLDNCEHVIDAARHLCDAILNLAPGVKILATSREALGCPTEQILDLPPLALPHDRDLLPKAICAAAAIELFVERARALNFELVDKDAPVAARICRRVDGLPLAIEMAAGWVSILGLQALDTKLDGSIRNWLSSRGAAPSRHSTLSATVEWSHDLLSAADQAVLRRLAVFAGSFNLRAAEAVASDANIPSGRIFEHLGSLASKSMVAVLPRPQEQQFRLLETTRAFMVEKLTSSNDYERTRQKHAGHVLDLVQSAMAEWETSSDAALQDRYRSLIDDVRIALDWTTEFEPDQAVALAGASWPLWRELSLFVEGRRRLDAAAARLRAGTLPDLEAQLRRGLGDLWLNTATVKEAAEPELVRAVKLYRVLNDIPRLGGTLVQLAFTYLMLDRLREAEQVNTEALRLLDPRRCPRMLAKAYSTQMAIESRLGRFASARASGEKAVSLSDAVGAARAALTVSANLVELTLENGDINAAISTGRDIAKRLRDTSYSDVHGFILGVLTAALTVGGQLDEALTIAREAAPLLRDQGLLFWLFDHLALRSGLAGRVTDSALLGGYADAIHQRNKYPRWPIGLRAAEQLRVLLRETLSKGEMVRLGEMGAQLSEDHALTLALGS